MKKWIVNRMLDRLISMKKKMMTSLNTYVGIKNRSQADIN